MRLANHVTRMRDWRGVSMVLVSRRVGKKPFGRTKLRWEDNINMSLQEERWGIAWTDLTEDRGR